MQEQESRRTIEELVSDIDQRLDQAEDHLQFTSPIIEREETGDKRRCVLMACGEYQFAVPLDGVAEIGSLPPMTSIPNVPGWIHGVVSVRGEVVSVVDIVSYFKWRKGTQLSGDRFVVLYSGGTKIGLRADAIIGSANVDFSNDIMEQVPMQESEDILFAKACRVEDSLYCLLTPEELLAEKSMLEW